MPAPSPRHVVIAALIASLIGCATVRGEAVAFEDLARGQYAAVDEPAYLVIGNSEDFAELWHHMHQGQSAEPPLPTVDFSRRMVLAVFQGQRPSGGHSIIVEDVVRRGDHLRVTVSKTVPSENDMVTMALTSPYHLVVVNLPAAATRVKCIGCP